MGLGDFKNELAKSAFGITPQEAFARGVCIQCQEDWKPKTHTEAGVREYHISAMCEECFDALWADDDDVDHNDIALERRYDNDDEPD